MPLPPGLGTDHEGTLPPVLPRQRPRRLTGVEAATEPEPAAHRRLTTEDLLRQLKASGAIPTGSQEPLTAEDLLRELKGSAQLPADADARPPAPPTEEEIAYLEELRTDIGLDKDFEVVRFADGMEAAADHRGAEHFSEDKIKHLPRIAKAIARGRIGAMHAVTHGGRANLLEATAMNPLVLALLEPGDGVAELLIASSAVAVHTTGCRVLAQLNHDLGKRPDPLRTEKWEAVHAKLRAGMTSDLTALEKIRALRPRNWDEEIRLVPRRAEDGDHVEIEPRASH